MPEICQDFQNVDDQGAEGNSLFNFLNDVTQWF